MELLDLNDDCLRYLCLFLDAESTVEFAKTCTTIKYIAEKLFKRINSYTCCIDSKESEKRAALTIKKIGKYLEKIGVMIELKFRCSDEFFILLTESLGKRLLELSILGEICFIPFTILAPLLQQLEILRIQNMCWRDDCVVRIDLPAFCRNLKELTVSGRVIFTPNLRKFQLLEKLDVDFDSEQSHHSVFVENTQIKKLDLWNRREIKYIAIDDLISTLVNLEELHLDVKLIKAVPTEILKISQFAILHTLWLYAIPVPQFNDVVENLKTLKRLKDISLQSELTRLDSEFLLSQQSLIGIATELKELESFATVNIDWTSETVSEFVGLAKNLRYYDFWSGLTSNYIVTPAFIRELAATRKYTVDETMEPLNLKMYVMDLDLRQVILENFLKNSKP